MIFYPEVFNFVLLDKNIACLTKKSYHNILKELYARLIYLYIISYIFLSEVLYFYDIVSLMLCYMIVIL